MASPDFLKDVRVGEAFTPSAARENAVNALLRRGYAGGNAFVDGTGVYPRPTLGSRNPWRLLQLTEALVSGGTADANPYNWDAGDAEYQADTGTTETVTDSTGGCAGADGDVILCREIDGRIESIRNLMAVRISAQLTAALASDTTTRNVDHVVAIDGGISPLADPTSTSETVAIHNTRGLVGLDDYLCWAYYDFAAGQWEFEWVKPIAKTIMTDWQVDDANHKIQVKTISTIVFAAAAESGWTDEYTGTVCE